MPIHYTIFLGFFQHFSHIFLKNLQGNPYWCKLILYQSLMISWGNKNVVCSIIDMENFIIYGYNQS